MPQPSKSKKLDIQPLDIQPLESGETKLDIQPLDIQPVESGPTADDIINYATRPMSPSIAGEPVISDNKSRLRQMWDLAVNPLTDLPSRIGRSLSEDITTPRLPGAVPEWMGNLGITDKSIAQMKGFYGGALEGIGDVISGFTSPLNLATLGFGALETVGARAGLGALARIGNYGVRGLSAPVVGQGAYHIGTAKSPTDVGMGIAEIAGGIAGLKQKLPNIASRTAGIPEPTPVNTASSMGRIAPVLDESGRVIAPPQTDITRPPGPWDANRPPTIDVTDPVAKAIQIINDYEGPDRMVGLTDEQLIEKASAIAPEEFDSRVNWNRGQTTSIQPNQFVLQLDAEGNVIPGQEPPTGRQIPNPDTTDEWWPTITQYTPEEQAAIRAIDEANTRRQAESLREPTEDELLVEQLKGALEQLKRDYADDPEMGREVLAELENDIRAAQARVVGAGRGMSTRPQLGDTIPEVLPNPERMLNTPVEQLGDDELIQLTKLDPMFGGTGAKATEAYLELQKRNNPAGAIPHSQTPVFQNLRTGEVIEPDFTTGEVTRTMGPMASEVGIPQFNRRGVTGETGNLQRIGEDIVNPQTGEIIDLNQPSSISNELVIRDKIHIPDEILPADKNFNFGLENPLFGNIKQVESTRHINPQWQADMRANWGDMSQEEINRYIELKSIMNGPLNKITPEMHNEFVTLQEKRPGPKQPDQYLLKLQAEQNRLQNIAASKTLTEGQALDIQPMPEITPIIDPDMVDLNTRTRIQEDLSKLAHTENKSGTMNRSDLMKITQNPIQNIDPILVAKIKSEGITEPIQLKLQRSGINPKEGIDIYGDNYGVNGQFVVDNGPSERMLAAAKAAGINDIPVKIVGPIPESIPTEAIGPYTKLYDKEGRIVRPSETTGTAGPGIKSTNLEQIVVKPTEFTPKRVKELREQGYEFRGETPDGNTLFEKTGEGTQQPILETEVAAAKPPKPPKQDESLLQKLYDLPRGLMSVDLPFVTSAAFRQAAPFVGTKAWFKAWVPAAKAYGSKVVADAQLKAIQERPLFRSTKLKDGTIQPSYAEKVGLRLGDINSPRGKVDDSLKGELAERIPVYGKHIAGSNRAFSAYLNDLSANVFEMLITDAQKLGKDPLNNLALGQEIAEFVNTALKRGTLGFETPFIAKKNVKGDYSPSNLKIKNQQVKLEKYSRLLANTFFSPRTISSQMRMLNPSTYVFADPFVRKQYLKAMIRNVGVWWTIAGLAKFGGAKVSTDPNSADFGKIRIGDTRIDVPGGLQQWLVLGNRTLPKDLGGGGITSTASEKFNEFGRGYKPETRFSNMLKFGINRLHPAGKTAVDILMATEREPFHVADRSIQLMAPLLTNDLMDVVKENPELSPLIIGASSVGIGTQTYERSEFGKPTFIPSEYDWNIGARSRR